MARAQRPLGAELAEIAIEQASTTRLLSLWLSIVLGFTMGLYRRATTRQQRAFYAKLCAEIDRRIPVKSV